MSRQATKVHIEALPSVSVQELVRSGRIERLATSARLAGGQVLTIVWAPGKLGGVRSWLLCDSCHHRRVRLYLAGRVLRCRVCLHLAYGTHREHRRERMRRKYAKIVQKIGGGPLDLNWPDLPPRPKGMRHRRYAELVAQAKAALAAFDAA